MKAACFLNNLGLFPPPVASALGKFHLIIVRSEGAYGGLSLGQAQESAPGAADWDGLASQGGREVCFLHLKNPQATRRDERGKTYALMRELMWQDVTLSTTVQF